MDRVSIVLCLPIEILERCALYMDNKRLFLTCVHLHQIWKTNDVIQAIIYQRLYGSHAVKTILYNACSSLPPGKFQAIKWILKRGCLQQSIFTSSGSIICSVAMEMVHEIAILFVKHGHCTAKHVSRFSLFLSKERLYEFVDICDKEGTQELYGSLGGMDVLIWLLFCQTIRNKQSHEILLDPSRGRVYREKVTLPEIIKFNNTYSMHISRTDLENFWKMT